MSGRSSSSTADLVEQTQQVAEGSAGRRTTKQLVEQMKPEFDAALPRQVDRDRFARIAMTTLRHTQKIAECSEESIAGGLLLCAQLGLEVGGPRQQAFLIPRKNRGITEASFQLGYRGLLDLARRSGEILDIQAREVCEADHFEWEYGLNERLSHRPADLDRGELTGAYCLARFTNGGHFFVVVSDEVIRKHHESRAYNTSDAKSPWQTDRPAMYRKSAVRAAEPWLPASVEFNQALAFDGAVTTRTKVTPLADLEAPPIPDQVIDVAVADPVDPPGDEAAPSDSGEQSEGENDGTEPF